MPPRLLRSRPDARSARRTGNSEKALLDLSDALMLDFTLTGHQCEERGKVYQGVPTTEGPGAP
jgi:hypothetical protein